MPAIHAIVSGRVQGVGFRWFVLEEAQRLKLCGWVRNCHSGREVEVVAEGPESGLKALLKALNQGPAFSRVSGVSVEWIAESGNYSGFDVAY